MGSEVQILPGPPSACHLFVLHLTLLKKVGVGLRGLSSAGRAPALQAGGHRFDPVSLHQSLRLVFECRDAKTHHGEDQVRRSAPCILWGFVCCRSVCAGASQGRVRSTAIIKTVNQVLVRLWACRGQPSLTGCVGVEICLPPRPRLYAFRGVM